MSEDVDLRADRPTAGELLEIIAETLQETVVPATEPHARHQARVAANLCRIVARDLADDATDTTAALTALLGAEGSLDDLAAVLDHRLAAGELLDEALPLLLADAARRAEIAKPGYTDDTN